MSNLIDEHRRVRVKSEKLLLLMKNSRFTREGISREARASGATLSAKTISRAINGESIELGKLRTICDVLHVPLCQLLNSKKINMEEVTKPELFEGRWRARFVEMRRSKGMRVINELAEITLQNGGLIAELHPGSEGETEKETVQWVKAIGNNLIGETWVDDWEAPIGVGLFHLFLDRADQMLDGVTSWADPDTGLVEWSRYVWVRESCTDDAVLKLSDTLIEQEVDQYNLRMKMRFGLK